MAVEATESNSATAKRPCASIAYTTSLQTGTQHTDGDRHWSLPPVVRFNHASGVAPYNGVVADMSNSCAVSATEYAADPAYAKICRECEEAAALSQVTAPIRVDVRKTSTAAGAAFAMFDITMKPNMTESGRPGREDQASLTALAAKEAG